MKKKIVLVLSDRPSFKLSCSEQGKILKRSCNIVIYDDMIFFIELDSNCDFDYPRAIYGQFKKNLQYTCRK